MVRANTSTASASLNRLNTNLRNSSKTAQTATHHTDNLTKSTGRLGPALRSAAKYAVGLGAAYVGLQAARDAFQATTDLAKATLNLNQNLGFASKTAIELSAQLKVRGADAKQTSQAFATFAGVLNQAAQGSTSAKDRF